MPQDFSYKNWIGSTEIDGSYSFDSKKKGRPKLLKEAFPWFVYWEKKILKNSSSNQRKQADQVKNWREAQLLQM